ncbi:MAG: hypothetical protein RR389_01105 [Christensenella sp.]
MSRTTSHYSFIKPDLTDRYDIEDQNFNMDKIDAALSELNAQIAESGTGIIGAAINNGDLVLTLSTGSVINVGCVIGPFVSGATINDAGRLIIKLSDGKIYDAGLVETGYLSERIHIMYADTDPTLTSDIKISTTPSTWMGIYIGSSQTAPVMASAYSWNKIRGSDGVANVSIIDYNPYTTPLLLMSNKNAYKLSLTVDTSPTLHFVMPTSAEKTSNLQSVITAYVHSAGATLVFDASEVYKKTIGVAGTPPSYTLPIGDYIMRAEYNPNIGRYVLRFENADSS